MGAVLVTGSLGGDQPHVTSAQDGLLHAGMLGRGGYLLQTRNWTQLPSAKNSNTITIPAWDIVMEGRQVMIDQPTDVTIQSGSQGVKRRDLIVVRYTMNASTGVEAVNLVAIKGTAAASPVDPAYNTGSIISGALTSDLPLCRVSIDGINVTGVDVLVNVLAPLSSVWDSLTQPLKYARFSMQNTGSFPPDMYGGGMQIIVDERNRLLHVDLSGFRSTVNVGDYGVFQHASGVKPSKPVYLGCLWAIPSGNFGKKATWNVDGSITVVGSLTNGDRCLHTPRSLPIPDGVTFA
ncbi:hypothetical protein BLI708_00410 [Bifidobacterium imperatoris]|uniref:Uncharacterized protein n=3 Tax=Bifidobacterium imperatoris TaxID=2020965 RepID=A0ABX7S241_9BIFI|nr:hypothetical protein [Bifidobacterium imperatoris]QSY57791.1 hypothetical protein BLI708_00115 [Bifidobacterium imperatoris]QSY57840.1 hypothetical protein BLI708_00410 [Bifidobacterium imperatoris]